VVGQVRCLRGWNTIVEEAAPAPLGSNAGPRKKGRPFALEDLKTEDIEPARRVTGIAEFDRVCGGGWCRAVRCCRRRSRRRKSTIILQPWRLMRGPAGMRFTSPAKKRCASALARLAMNLSDSPVALGSATCVEDILATLDKGKPPGIVAIDSIQTLWTGTLEAAPGTIAQVRTASFDLVRYAKSTGAALIPGRPVTKTARLPGPKWSSTWSTQCFISKASAVINSVFCGR